MAPPYKGFRQVNSVRGLSEGVEESGENRDRFWKRRTASGQLELRIENYLYRFIPKLMSYGQSLFRIPAMHVY